MDIERTTDDWLTYLGEQFRESRIRMDLRQEELAKLANVSIATIKNLEGGKGSSMSTVVQVVRALDRTDWLTSLAPSITVSPMQLLKRSKNEHRKLRVGKRTVEKE